MHETLQWIHITNRQKGRPPSLKETLAEFKLLLSKNHLSQQELKNLLVRGHSSLKVYLEQRKQTISIDNESEYNFRGESVFLGDAHLGGKIDKLVIDKKSKQITIVDFKTGRSYKRWEHNIKLHKYRQQLYLYKYLVENSRSYQGYRVTDAYIEFIEPDDKGEITELHIAFDVKEMNRVDKLLRSIWKHIQTLDMPDTSQYGDNLSSVMKFEDDLVSGKI
jgi:RecB family exonuclease